MRREEESQMFKPNMNQNSLKINKRRQEDDTRVKKLVQSTDNVDYYLAYPPSVKDSLYTGRKSAKNSSAKKTNQPAKNARTSTPARKSTQFKPSASRSASQSKLSASKPAASQKISSIRGKSRSTTPTKKSAKKSTVPDNLVHRSPDHFETARSRTRTASKSSSLARSRSQSKQSKTNQGLPLKSSLKKPNKTKTA